MSYSIQLYRKEVKEKYFQSEDNTFFGKKENLIPFTEKQIEDLIQRLLNYGYSIESKGKHGIHFKFKDDDGIEVLLSGEGLYFSSTGSGVFEIGMTASEFTDTGEYSKFDPQCGEWE